MAGFGSGRSRGGGGGRSRGGGPSHGGHHGGRHHGGHHHHHMHRPRRHRRVYVGGGGPMLSGNATLILAGVIMFIIGIFMFLMYEPNDYEKVTAVITNVEEKTDEYGDYYDYDIEYNYNSQTIKNTWEDDYYQPVGYEFSIYIDKDNPAYFDFDVDKEEGKIHTIGMWVMIGGGVLFALGVFKSIFKGVSGSDD